MSYFFTRIVRPPVFTTVRGRDEPVLMPPLPENDPHSMPSYADLWPERAALRRGFPVLVTLHQRQENWLLPGVSSDALTL